VESEKPSLSSFNPKTGQFSRVVLPQWYVPERCDECDESVCEEKEFNDGKFRIRAQVRYCKLVEDEKPCKVNGQLYKVTEP
jgi:hypothetical protein